MLNLKLNDPAKAKEFFQDKLSFTIGPVEAEKACREGEGCQLIDLRAKGDFERGHPSGAINLPEENWASQLVLDKNKVNILSCYSHVCHLAAKAAVLFAGQGFPVMEMDGGFAEWKENGLPIEIDGAKKAAS